MTLVERLSLIAVQYDLTFAIAADGKQIDTRADSVGHSSDAKLSRRKETGGNGQEIRRTGARMRKLKSPAKS